MTELFDVFENEGFDALVTVAFDALTGATSLTGGATGANALNVKTGAKVVGVATITSATTIHATHAASTLAPGVWSVQVRATPVGFAEQVVADAVVTVKTKAAP